MKISEKQAKKIIKNLGKRHGIYVDAVRFNNNWVLIGSLKKITPNKFYINSYNKFLCDKILHRFIVVESESIDNVYRTALNEILKISRDSDIIFPYRYFKFKSYDDSHLVLVPKGISLYELLIQTDLNSLEK